MRCQLDGCPKLCHPDWGFCTSDHRDQHEVMYIDPYLRSIGWSEEWIQQRHENGKKQTW